MTGPLHLRVGPVSHHQGSYGIPGVHGDLRQCQRHHSRHQSKPGADALYHQQPPVQLAGSSATGIKRAHGIKTGSTDAAGHCLISSAQQGELHYVSVVMGAERIEENGVGNLLNFSETSRLFDYGFGNFSYRPF